MTGVRFIQKNRVLFIQPQVSKLIGIGRVDSNTTHWVDLPQLVWNEKDKEFSDTFTLQYNHDNQFDIGSFSVMSRNQYLSGKSTLHLLFKKILESIFPFRNWI